MGRLRGFVLACCVFLAVVAAGCSGAGSPGQGVSAIVQPERHAVEPVLQEVSPRHAISMDQALSDLAALDTPPGVDPQFFNDLKASFARVLGDLYAPDGTPRGKAASTLPVSQMCQAWALDGRTRGVSEVEVTWYGRHTGDYDLNSEVNVSDLTPLGLHFNKIADYDAEGLPLEDQDNEHMCQVDGDDNTEINIADLTAIGLNFGSVEAGYRVYPGYSADGVNFTWEPDYVEGPDSGGDVSVSFNTSTAAGEVMRYALTFDKPAIPQGATLYVKIVPFDGMAEGTPETMPVYDGPHSSSFCSMCHTKVQKTFLGQDDSCLHCHAKSPEGADWSSGPLLHQACMNCHESHVFAIDPAESVCSNCHTTQATQVQTSGMTACLDCHQTPHVPDASPSAATCGGCHTGQASELSGSPMTDCNGCHVDHEFVITDEAATCKTCHSAPPDKPESSWTDAPGLHGDCGQCHNEHSFAITDANGVCADCHQSKIDSGHAGGATDCLTCHASPHVPEVDVSGMDCTDCHPTPPEDPARTWADAPGLHADCGQCHSLTDHGDKPDPPESVCGDCHQPLIDEGHAGGISTCMDCHVYPHLPESNMGGQDCVFCHPTPPEDPSRTWADAPGLHADCGQCHSLTEHGDKPEPPESVCGDCHQPLIDEGHAGGITTCLGCHNYAHLPDVNGGGGDDCISCHPVPPEAPDKTWDDVPGLHDQCGECHLGDGHPVPKPTKEEIQPICLGCHPEFDPEIPGNHQGALCLDCHDGGHMVVFNEENCAICHPF